MRVIYEAVIEQEASDLYTVELPDWGSVTEAESFEDAVKMGIDLLEAEVTYALANGRDLPCPVSKRRSSGGEERAWLAIETDEAQAMSRWPWVSTAQAATLLGVTTGRVRKLVLDGALRAEKEGRDLLVSRSDVVARVKKQPKPGRPKLATKTAERPASLHVAHA